MSYTSSLPMSSRPGDPHASGGDFVATDPIGDAIFSDPFVSRLDRNRIKPIDEILRNLNGYRVMESPHPNSQGDLGRSTKSLSQKGSDPLEARQEISTFHALAGEGLTPFGIGSKSEPGSVQFEYLPPRQENSNAATTATSGLPLEFKPDSQRFTVSSVKQWKGKQAQIQSSTGQKFPVNQQTIDSLTSLHCQPPKVDEARRFQTNDDQTAELPIPIDIRDFAPGEPQYERVLPPELEPIPGAFQFDPEFFEHQATQRHLNQLAALDQELAHVIASELALDPHAGLESSVESFRESPRANELAFDDSQTEEFGVIYAQHQQVIYVDGKDGFEFIDLSCFDIAQASFQANRIRIRTERQEFEIDYRNITHVLFANGREVELACEEQHEQTFPVFFHSLCRF